MKLKLNMWRALAIAVPMGMAAVTASLLGVKQPEFAAIIAGIVWIGITQQERDDK